MFEMTVFVGGEHVFSLDSNDSDQDHVEMIYQTGMSFAERQSLVPI